MKRKLAILFALIGWFAIITQFVLMIEHRTISIAETTLRFFSFFTILTNILVAIYFTCIASLKNQESKLISKSGILTAVTAYITMVGLVYQIALRHVWAPGLMLIVDELFHSVIPVLVIIFWYLYETTKVVKYSQILKWTIYPLAYLFYILVRGSISNFYPYPFIDVTNLGMAKALTNAAVISLIFIIIAAIFLFIGKSVVKR